MNNPWQHFKRYAAIPDKPTVLAQQQWLMACLRHNQTTDYGQLYQFTTISSIKEYQAQVPVTEYEQLSPWIDRLLAGDKALLFKGEVIAFERTGGSHSGGKLIPYSAKGLADFRQVLLTWLAQLVNQYAISDGSAYWALSPATRKAQVTKQGIAIGGGDALYLGQENISAFLALSAVPLSVGEVTDIQTWQVLTLYYLICHDDLRLISIWSPSFLIELIKALTQHHQVLLEILKQGGVIGNHRLNANLLAAKRLEDYLRHQQTARLWPQLAVISCWADASSSVLAKALQDYFPLVRLQPKGLLATEAVISTPNELGQALLCTAINFYEFLGEQGNIHLAHELTVGENYQVIVTTNSGFYRYNTGDVVCCLGYQGDKAILQFMGRAGITADLVGEKLNEPFVNQCLSSLKGFAMLCTNQASCGYTLLLDNAYWQANKALLDTVEPALCHNPQYAYARKLNQLAPLTYQLLDNPSQRYLAYQQAQGKRLGDIKIPTLLTAPWQTLLGID